MDRCESPAAGVGQHATTDATAHHAGADPAARVCDWRQFHDRLRHAAIRSFRTGNPFALLLAEICDRANPGEALGETLTRLFAAHVGGGGAVVRYGQGTLIGILPDTEVEAAHAVAEAFRHATLAHGETQGAEPIDLHSVAISGYDPHEPLSQLLKRAFDRLRAAEIPAQS